MTIELLLLAITPYPTATEFKPKAHAPVPTATESEPGANASAPTATAFEPEANASAPTATAFEPEACAPAPIAIEPEPGKGCISSKIEPKALKLPKKEFELSEKENIFSVFLQKSPPPFLELLFVKVELATIVELAITYASPPSFALLFLNVELTIKRLIPS